MKIRMLIGLAGKDFSLAPNEVTERFPEAEAQRMIDHGVAVSVEPMAAPKREKAVKKPAPETRS